MYVVYALIDPRDNTIHYIGITDDVYRRFVDHIQCGGSNLVKNLWLLELRKANRMVIMETLEETQTREQALKREEYWIKHFEMLKEPIANINKTASARRSKRTTLKYGTEGIIEKTTADFHPVKVVREPVSHVLPDSDREKIIALARSGMARRKICQTLSKGHAYYKVVKAILDQEGL